MLDLDGLGRDCASDRCWGPLCCRTSLHWNFSVNETISLCLRAIGNLVCECVDFHTALLYKYKSLVKRVVLCSSFCRFFQYIGFRSLWDPLAVKVLLEAGRCRCLLIARIFAPMADGSGCGGLIMQCSGTSWCGCRVGKSGSAVFASRRTFVARIGRGIVGPSCRKVLRWSAREVTGNGSRAGP